MRTVAVVTIDECGNLTVEHAEPGVSVHVDEYGVIRATRSVPVDEQEQMFADRDHEERNGRPQRAPWR